MGKYLLVYYDVPANKQKAYNIIYYGSKKDDVLGLKGKAIALNKSVYVCKDDIYGLVLKLVNYVRPLGVSIYVSEISLTDEAVVDMWNVFKLKFIEKVRKLVDKFTSQGDTSKLKSIVNTKLQEMLDVALSFGLSDKPELYNDVIKKLAQFVGADVLTSNSLFAKVGGVGSENTNN